nr:unnamed protein product [Callosobruchus chinensis]
MEGDRYTPETTIFFFVFPVLLNNRDPVRDKRNLAFPFPLMDCRWYTRHRKDDTVTYHSGDNEFISSCETFEKQRWLMLIDVSIFENLDITSIKVILNKTALNVFSLNTATSKEVLEAAKIWKSNAKGVEVDESLCFGLRFRIFATRMRTYKRKSERGKVSKGTYDKAADILEQDETKTIRGVAKDFGLSNSDTSLSGHYENYPQYVEQEARPVDAQANLQRKVTLAVSPKRHSGAENGREFAELPENVLPNISRLSLGENLIAKFLRDIDNNNEANVSFAVSSRYREPPKLLGTPTLFYTGALSQLRQNYLRMYASFFLEVASGGYQVRWTSTILLIELKSCFISEKFPESKLHIRKYTS